LVHRNKSDYPAVEGKPATSHADLMILYRDVDQVRAEYWDSEGHVIHYSVEGAVDGTMVRRPDESF
jgi:hypothetical protein